MALYKSANRILFPRLMVIVVFSLPLISTENIDCKGKAFHCVNSTHFKICVDLGGGESRTVDEFLIPCPKSTVCNDINNFECELQVTTTLPSTQQTDVTNVLVELVTASPWDNVDVTTFVPENDSNNSSATTIETSDLLTINETINFISSTALDDPFNQVDPNRANNVTYNKTNNVSDEYRITTALPSIQQRDVTSVIEKLDKTSAWDVDVTTLASENNTIDSSATTIGTSYLITTNEPSILIPSAFDDKLKQVNSSSVNNVEYNETSYVSDSATVKNIGDVSTVNAQVTLNNIILNSTLNKSVLPISGELSLAKTNQGETGINIDVLDFNNTSLYVNNNEEEYTNDVGNLPSPLSRIIENPILYSTETTSFLSDYNTSTTPVSVSSNLNIVNDASKNLLRPTITTDTSLYSVDTEHPINFKGEQIMTTFISHKPLTTVASEPFTNMALEVRDISNNDDKKVDTVNVISQTYSSTENTPNKTSTKNVVNGWNGFKRNIVEQNKFNKTETSFTLVSSNAELSTTKSVESSTLPYTYDGFTMPIENDWQNSENIVTSSVYTTNSYLISEFQNHSADMHVLPTGDVHLVTPVVNIFTEVLHNVTITNESLTQYIMESNTPADVEISNITKADLKSSNLKVIYNDSNMVTDVSPTSDLVEISLTELSEINVTNNTMYNDVSSGLTTDDKRPVNFNNTNTRNISSGDFNNNDTSFVVENTSTVTPLIADLYKTTSTVSHTAFTFLTNASLANTDTLNINFNSTSITIHPDSNDEYFQPTTTAHNNVKITNMEKPSSSDLNLNINNRISTDYPNKTATIETLDNDSRDYISSNLSLSRMHDNISVSFLDTTTINQNQDIEKHVNERLNSFYFSNKNNTLENIINAEKTDVLISSPNTTYGQLNLRSSGLTTSKDTISVHPFALQLNNSNVNKTNSGGPNATNNNYILNTFDEQVQSSLDENVAGNNLNITKGKEEYKTFNLPLSDANFTINNNLISIDKVIGTTLPIQKQNLIQLETHENKTDDGNTKPSEIIFTNEAVTIADSSNFFLTGNEEPREIYDSVTPHILDTMKPYIYQKKDLATNNSYANETNWGVLDVTNNNDILNVINEQVQSSLDQTVTGNNLNITQENKEYKTLNLPLSDTKFTINNNLNNIDKVIETTLPIQKLKLKVLETYENKTDDVNTKTSELISTTEPVTIANSSHLFISSYKELRQTYDSVTPHILDTTNPYIYQKEDLTIAEPPRNTNNQQNSTDSPFGMKINSLHFNNSLSVNRTLNLPSNPINIAQTKLRVVMPDQNYNDNSSSTTSNVYKDHKNGAITTKVNVEVHEEKIIGTSNNDTLTHIIDKIKSELTGADVSSSSKNLSILETESASNFELPQDSKQLNNDSTLQYYENKNNVNIVALLGKTNNTRILKQNENKMNEVLTLLQDSNLRTTTTPNIVRTTSTPKGAIKTLTVKLTNDDSRVGNQTPPSEQFTCEYRVRGKYSDKSNCNKFYICLGKRQPIIGMCPEDTVFSEIRKQCTNNLSHCIRNNQFRCLSSGRFIDVLSEQFYYICVKKLDGYVRFKLKCQKGYHLNKEKIQCSADTSIENSSNSTSDKSTKEMKSEDTSHSSNYKIRFECENEGKFEHPDDCRKYFVCRKNSKSKFRRKIKKCSSDEVFNKEKRKCVDADSYEC